VPDSILDEIEKEENKIIQDLARGKLFIENGDEG